MKMRAASLCFCAMITASEVALGLLHGAKPPDEVAQDPPRAGAPYQRLLKGDDAQEVATLEAKVISLQHEGKFAAAVTPAEQIVAIRLRVQGQDHWETTDARQTLDLCRHLAALSRDDQDDYLAALKLVDEALGLEEKGQVQEAEPLLRRTLEIRSRVLGEDHPNTVASCNNLAANLHSQGRYADAEALFRKSLQDWRRVLGDYDVSTALAHNNLASSLESQRKFAEAEPLFRKSLEIRRHTLGEDHPDTADSYRNLAHDLKLQARYNEAQPLYRRALEIRRELREDDPITSVFYNDLASCLVAQDKYAEAESLFRKALEIRRVLGEDDPITSAYYGNLASCLVAQDKYGEAESLLRKSLEISLRVKGKDHPDTAITYNILAQYLDSQCKHAEAEPLFRNTLDILQSVQGEDHRNTGIAYAVLADNLSSQSRCAEAELLYRKALSILRHSQGEDHPDTGGAYNNLAGNLDFQGRHGEAEALFRKALETALRVVGEDHSFAASSYSNLGSNLALQDRHAEAEPLLRKALDIRLRLSGEDHWETARSYSNLAECLTSQAKYGEAESLLGKAMEISRLAFGEYHTLTATCYNNAGLHLHSQRKHAAAEPFFRKALAIHRRLQGEDHADVANSYNNLTANLHVQGKYGEAARLLVQAAATFEAVRLKVATRGLDRASYGAKSSPYPALACLHARLQMPIAAWVAAETDLARGLADELATQRDSSLTEEEQQQKDTINDQIGRLQPRILQLVTKLESTDSERDELAKLLSERAAAEHQLNNLAATLSQREVAGLAAIQAAIPDSTALVLWIDVSGFGSIEEHWGCVVRSSGEPTWERLPGTRTRQQDENGSPESETQPDWTDDDTALTHKFRDALASSTASAAEIEELAQSLHDQRIAPLAPHLVGVKTLYVVAVSQMAGIPVELLTDRYTICYVPSGTFLARLKDRTPAGGSALLALGDPIFNRPGSSPSGPGPLPPSGLLITVVAPDSPAAAAQLQPRDVLLSYGGVKLTSVETLSDAIATQAQTEAQEIPLTVWREDAPQPFTRTVPPGRLGVVLDQQPAPQAIANRRQIDAMLLATRGGEWNDLTGTRYEVAQIARLFGGETLTLLDSAASEQSLDELRKRDELSKFRYLHLATHGAANNVPRVRVDVDPVATCAARCDAAGTWRTVARRSTVRPRSAGVLAVGRGPGNPVGLRDGGRPRGGGRRAAGLCPGLSDGRQSVGLPELVEGKRLGHGAVDDAVLREPVGPAHRPGGPTAQGGGTGRSEAVAARTAAGRGNAPSSCADRWRRARHGSRRAADAGGRFARRVATAQAGGSASLRPPALLGRVRPDRRSRLMYFCDDFTFAPARPIPPGKLQPGPHYGPYPPGVHWSPMAPNWPEVCC